MASFEEDVGQWTSEYYWKGVSLKWWGGGKGIFSTSAELGEMHQPEYGLRCISVLPSFRRAFSSLFASALSFCSHFCLVSNLKIYTISNMQERILKTCWKMISFVSVRNCWLQVSETQLKCEKKESDVSAQHNWEGQFRINWLRQLVLSGLCFSVFLGCFPVCGRRDNSPYAYQLHKARVESKQHFCMDQVEMSWEEFPLAELWAKIHPSLCGWGISLCGWGIRSAWWAKQGHMAFLVWGWGEMESALPKPWGGDSL